MVNPDPFGCCVPSLVLLTVYVNKSHMHDSILYATALLFGGSRSVMCICNEND